MSLLMRLICLATALSAGFCASVRAEVTLAVYTGTSWTHSSDVRIGQSGSQSNAEFHAVRWEARPFQGAPYYGVQLSYFPSRSARLGGSLDFTHYKMYAETGRVTAVRGMWNGAPVNEAAPVSKRVQSLEISHGVNLTSLNVDYRWLADSSSGLVRDWRPHVGAGVVVYVPHAEGSINGVSSTADYQLAGAGYQLLAGIEYHLRRHLGALLEAKFDQGELDIDLRPLARVKTTVRTAHALAGLAWHF